MQGQHFADLVSLVMESRLVLEGSGEPLKGFNRG